MSHTAPTSIAIAVVEHEDRFLIGPRSADLALGGLWEFPGGKVEPGETGEQAAVRECFEETGMHVRVIAEILENVHEYEHDTVHLHFFQCEVRQSSEAPREPFRWVERRRLGDFSFPSGNRELLGKLLG